MKLDKLRALLLEGNPEFWRHLKVLTEQANGFDELFPLSSWRKKARARQLPKLEPTSEAIRIAIMGGYSLYPFHELVEHVCEMHGITCEFWLGDYDNYISEIVDDESELYSFKPQVVMLIPSEHRCRYPGFLNDSRAAQQAAASQVVSSVLELAAKVHEKSRAEVILTNFVLPARHDLGAYRSRTLGSDWSFRKQVNLEL